MSYVIVHTYTITHAKFAELLHVTQLTSAEASEQRNKKIYQCCIYGAINYGAINHTMETANQGSREPNPHYSMLSVAMDLVRELRTRHSSDDIRDQVITDIRAAPTLKFFNADGTFASFPPVETSTNPPDFPSRLCPERFLAWLLRRYVVDMGIGVPCNQSVVVLSQGFLYDPIYIASLHPHTCDYQCVVRAIALGFDYFDNPDDFLDLVSSVTSITHRCARCINSCICVAAVVRSIITESDPTNWIRVVKEELVANGLIVSDEIAVSRLENLANNITCDSVACALYFMYAVYNAYMGKTSDVSVNVDRRDLHLFIEGCAYGLMYTGIKKQISGFIKCRSNIGNFINEF